jgi:hypothetical protein
MPSAQGVRVKKSGRWSRRLGRYTEISGLQRPSGILDRVCRMGQVREILISPVGHTFERQLQCPRSHSRLYNESKSTITIYQKALATVDLLTLDWPEMLFNGYSTFVRETGSLEHFQDAARLLMAPRRTVLKRRADEAVQANQSAMPPQSTSVATRDENMGSRAAHEGQGRSSQFMPSSRGRGVGRSVGRGRGARGGAAGRRDMPASRSSNKRSRNDKEDGATPKRSRVRAHRDDNADPARSTYHETDPSQIPLTVFVSNLPLQVTEEQLRTFFAPCPGSMTEVRIVRDTRIEGREKTFAYVVFSTDEGVANALEMDRMGIDMEDSGNKRPVFVSRFKVKDRPVSDTPKVPDTAMVSEADSRTLFVTNLPFEITATMLTEMFSEASLVTDVNETASPYTDLNSRETVRTVERSTTCCR